MTQSIVRKSAKGTFRFLVLVGLAMAPSLLTLPMAGAATGCDNPYVLNPGDTIIPAQYYLSPCASEATFVSLEQEGTLSVQTEALRTGEYKLHFANREGVLSAPIGASFAVADETVTVYTTAEPAPGYNVVLTFQPDGEDDSIRADVLLIQPSDVYSVG